VAERVDDFEIKVSIAGALGHVDIRHQASLTINHHVDGAVGVCQPSPSYFGTRSVHYGAGHEPEIDRYLCGSENTRARKERDHDRHAEECDETLTSGATREHQSGEAILHIILTTRVPEYSHRLNRISSNSPIQLHPDWQKYWEQEMTGGCYFPVFETLAVV
jgi:hypothetical protein